jgi:hypothetical protein
VSALLLRLAQLVQAAGLVCLAQHAGLTPQNTHTSFAAPFTQTHHTHTRAHTQVLQLVWCLGHLSGPG